MGPRAPRPPTPSARAASPLHLRPPHLIRGARPLPAAFGPLACPSVPSSRRYRPTMETAGLTRLPWRRPAVRGPAGATPHRECAAPARGTPAARQRSDGSPELSRLPTSSARRRRHRKRGRWALRTESPGVRGGRPRGGASELGLRTGSGPCGGQWPTLTRRFALQADRGVKA